MLKTRLIHPELLSALGCAGHGSKVLVADGNYPFSSGGNPAAQRVYLNLAPGLIGTPDILRVLAEAIPLEKVEVMMPSEGGEPPVFAEFRAILGAKMPLSPLERFAFYDAARHLDTVLVIASGEQRLYANLLLTIGVVPP
jgi:L-fucose mutarotase